MDIKKETLILLFGLKPEANKDNSCQWFWEKFENSEENKNGKWKEEFDYLIHNWRLSNSIPVDLYNFLKKYYPYPIPSSLFFSYKNENWEDNADNFRKLATLAHKWLKDIFSGESFYNLNKEYFSKSEVSAFLTCEWEENRYEVSKYKDLIFRYFNSIIKTKNLNLSPNIFADKFNDCFANPITINYFKLVCKYHKHFKSGEIADIGDFLKKEYINRNINLDFNNISWKDIKRLSLEWHNSERYKNTPFLDNKIYAEWKKTFKDYKRKENDITWTIIEITTGKSLYEEGEDMNHCVFSYIDYCIRGYRKIFSLRCMHNNEIDMKKSATLEIDNDMRLLQARGKYNAEIDDDTVNIIEKWSAENRINSEILFIEKNGSEQEYEDNSNTEDESNLIREFAYKTDKTTWLVKEEESKSIKFADSYGNLCNTSYSLKKDERSFVIKSIFEKKEAILIISGNMELIKIIPTDLNSQNFDLDEETKEIINIWATENLVKWNGYFDERWDGFVYSYFNI